MNVMRQIRPMAQVLPQGRRDRYDLLRWLRHQSDNPVPLPQ